MKSSIQYILIICFFTFISCGDDYLDVEPIDRYVFSNFAKNQGQVEQAVTACYAQTFPIVSNFLWFYGDYVSDNTSYYRNPTDRGQVNRELIDEFLGEATNGNYAGMYQPSFEGVARANYVIGSIDKVTFSSDSLKNMRKAEARFFRAWHYFNLVRVYGDVPLLNEIIIDQRKSFDLKRDPLSKIFDEIIIPDAQAGVAALPIKVTSSNSGRLTKGAAAMLLAKALMTQGKFAAALPVLQEVTKYGYSLNANYIDNFSPSRKNSIESIYELQSGVIGFNIGMAGIFAPYGSGSTIWGGGATSTGGVNQPTEDLIKAYEDADSVRRKVVVGIWKKSPTEEIPYMAKFNYFDAALNGNAANFPVYRYADALLMLAECQNETGDLDGALSNLNLIRARAKIPAKTKGNSLPAYAVNNQAEARLAIEKERQVELAGEGHRWFDLVRTNRAQQILKEHGVREKATKKEYVPAEAYDKIRTLMPFPQRELDQFKNFTQTPGW